MIPGIKKPHTLQFSACGRSFPHSALKSREIEGVKARKQFFYLAFDRIRAARGVGLDVQRHVRIVQRHAQERPAAVHDDAHALIGGAGDCEAFCLCALLEGGEDLSAVCLRVVRTDDLDADLALLRRIAQICDEVAERPALRARLRRRDDELYREIGAVVEEVVLRECAVDVDVRVLVRRGKEDMIYEWRGVRWNLPGQCGNDGGIPEL